MWQGLKRRYCLRDFPGRDAMTVLKECGKYSDENVRQCEEIRSAFFSSNLMKRVKRSYCEVAFVITREGKRVTGTIDRLLAFDDGSWAVIDYKSEAVGLKSDATVFIDANIFLNVVLGTGKEVAACTRFLEDAEAGLFPCATSVIVLNEVLHRLLIASIFRKQTVSALNRQSAR